MVWRVGTSLALMAPLQSLTDENLSSADFAQERVLVACWTSTATAAMKRLETGPLGCGVGSLTAARQNHIAAVTCHWAPFLGLGSRSCAGAHEKA